MTPRRGQPIQESRRAPGYQHQPCQPAPGRPPRTLTGDSVSAFYLVGACLVGRAEWRSLRFRCPPGPFPALPQYDGPASSSRAPRCDRRAPGTLTLPVSDAPWHEVDGWVRRAILSLVVSAGSWSPRACGDGDAMATCASVRGWTPSTRCGRWSGREDDRESNLRSRNPREGPARLPCGGTPTGVRAGAWQSSARKLASMLPDARPPGTHGAGATDTAAFPGIDARPGDWFADMPSLRASRCDERLAVPRVEGRVLDAGHAEREVGFLEPLDRLGVLFRRRVDPR